jgi:hypothetical protein
MYFTFLGYRRGVTNVKASMPNALLSVLLVCNRRILRHVTVILIGPQVRHLVIASQAFSDTKVQH